MGCNTHMALILFGAPGGGIAAKEMGRPLVIDYWLPQGTDISRTADDLAEVETYVREVDCIGNITSFIGSGGLRFILTYNSEPANSAYGQLERPGLHLWPQSRRRKQLG